MQNQADLSHSGDVYAAAAIMVLLVLTSAMPFAVFTHTEPHPPLEVEPFALAPFLAVSLATGAAACVLKVRGMRFATAIAIFFALTSLVSCGPQRYVDPAFPKTWPAVIVAQFAIAVLLDRAVLRTNQLMRSTDGGLV